MVVIPFTIAVKQDNDPMTYVLASLAASFFVGTAMLCIFEM
jgi:hypothetical protein